MRGVLFHKIKAVFGWGSRVRNLDVTRVVDMCSEKRWFMIFDRYLPYTLRIKYYDPESESSIMPIFASKGIGFGLSDKVETHKTITFRYPNERELMKDHDEIDRLRKALKRLYLKNIEDIYNKDDEPNKETDPK
jgi:hypothetical protein